MQKKFLCAFAIFAIVAAMIFSEADACNRCKMDCCSGCGPALQSYAPIALPSLPSLPAYSTCDGCSGYYDGPSHYPKRYCGGCLRRKSLRLCDNCNCGC